MSKRVMALLAFVVLSSCGRSDGGGQSNNPRPVLRADGILVKTTPFSSIISSTADILPNEQVELSSPVSGNILEIYFREGQLVRKGDLLVKIDDRSWNAQLKGLEARLVSAQNELNRSQALLEIEGASQENVDRAQAEVTNIHAQIEELQVMINLANVRAPFSGRVGMRDFSTGAYLSQGQTITQLVQTNKVRINFTLPSRYAGLIKENQKIAVVPSATKDTSIAVIYAIHPMLNMNTRSLQVRAILDNENGLFVPGDFATVKINLEQVQEAMLIPSESIIPELNSNVVFKMDNGKARRQEVELGIRTETSVQVIRGISVGDTVLVTGLLQIEDGSPIEFGEIIEGERL